ncbi:MAG: D-alanyl-D-alanine carboxypeptidase family protein [Oscillospiraceae bacterium]|nr:D-alanyl-D-alanine carboxypeptidase family protein [Oscillospiraceae bacterium]
MRQIKSKVTVISIAAALAVCLGFFVFLRSESPGKQETPDSPRPSETVFVPPTTAVPTAAPSSALPAPVTPTPDMTPEPRPGIPDIDITSWQYRPVNTENPLSEDYIPELTDIGGGILFDSRAAESMAAFISGARESGLSVYVSSAYRSYATQKYLFDNKVAQVGSREAAARIVACPGTSEHQLGLAADIVDRYYEYMNESLAETPLSVWLFEHCAEYGFILRYPRDKQEITGIMFEPWHYRYVGDEVAGFIMENGLCLEEFCALYE